MQPAWISASVSPFPSLCRNSTVLAVSYKKQTQPIIQKTKRNPIEQTSRGKPANLVIGESLNLGLKGVNRAHKAVIVPNNPTV